MPQEISIGSIIADLQVDSSNMERGLENGRKAMGIMIDELRNLDKAFEVGAIDANEYIVRVKQLKDEMASLAFSMREAYAASTTLNSGFNQVNTRLAGLNKQNNYAKQSFLQLAYAADDVRYGFMNIVNNIPGIALGLGFAPEAAGAIALIAANVAIWYQNWEELLKIINDTDDLKKVKKDWEGVADAVTSYLSTLANLDRFYDKIFTKHNYAEFIKMLTLPGYKPNFEGGGTVDNTAKQREDAEKAKKEKEDREKEEKKALESVNDINSKTDSDKGKGIKDAVEALAGGGKEAIETLANATFNKNPAAFGGKDAKDKKDKVRGQIAKMLKDAMGGDKGALESLNAMVPKDSDFAKAIEKNTPDAKEKDKFEKEGKKNEEKWKAQQKKWIEEQAKQFLKGELGFQALSGDKDFTEMKVEERLNKSGVDHDKAAATAGKVRQQIQDDTDESVRKHAQEKGMTFDDARKEMVRDRKKEMENEHAKEAKEAVPGIEDITKKMLQNAALTGASVTDVQKKLQSLLKDSGMSDEDKARAAEGLTNEAGKDLQKQAIDEMMNPEEPEQGKQKKKVEQFNASDLASRIQNSVGGEDVQKEQLAAQKKMQAALEKLAGQQLLQVNFGAR